MTSPVRIVSTSDRYDLDWERSAFHELTDLPIEYTSASISTSAELIAAAQGAQAIVIGARDAINDEVLDALPDLIVVGRLSVGLDNIDLDAATRHKVVITHYPQYCTHEVADHAIAMIYALNRNLVEFDRDLRSGAWIEHQFQMDKLLRGRIRALRTLTLGIIGLGRIGQQVARRMSGSVAKIVAFDPYLDPAIGPELGVERVDLDTLLGSSDIVTIHCPLTPETHHLIDSAALAKMLPDAILVNTARGPIIDGDALNTALAVGTIAGAAVDVFETEPLPLESVLHQHPNLIVTPHAAYYSEQSADTIRRETMASVLNVLQGFEPSVTANYAVLERLNLRKHD